MSRGELLGTRRSRWLAGGPVTLAAGLLLALAILPSRPWAISDVAYFFDISERVTAGAIPYRDVFLEFPPLSLVAVLAPRLLTAWQPISLGVYLVLFALVMAVLALVLSRRFNALARARLDPGRARSAGIAFALGLALGLPVLLFRFDLLTMLLTLLALEAIVRVAPVRTGVMIGLGAAAKLYPALLLPAAVGAWLVARLPRAAVSSTAAAGLVIALVALPFIVLAPAGVLDAVRFQAARGLQIETLPAGIIQLANLFDPDRIRIGFDTTHELRMTAADAVLAVQPLVAAGAIGLACIVVAWRLGRRPGAGDLGGWAAGLALVLGAFVLTNRALSPQHVFWLAPLVPLAGARAGWVYVAAAGLTLLVFPVLYEPLLASEPIPILLLNARNLLLVALVPMLLRRLMAGAQPAVVVGAPGSPTGQVRDRATAR